MKKKKTIAEHMADVLTENNYTLVWMGDCDLIEECASRANMKASRPPRRYRNVLAALDRSPLFTKGYLTACNMTGKPGLERNQRFRCFRLKNKPPANRRPTIISH